MREDADEFGGYLNPLARALGHADRHASFNGYCSVLVVSLSRKSVEPMATSIDQHSRECEVLVTPPSCGQGRQV
jgi:SRSO17 transposase